MVFFNFEFFVVGVCHLFFRVCHVVGPGEVNFDLFALCDLWVGIDGNDVSWNSIKILIIIFFFILIVFGYFAVCCRLFRRFWSQNTTGPCNCGAWCFVSIDPPRRHNVANRRWRTDSVRRVASAHKQPCRWRISREWISILAWKVPAFPSYCYFDFRFNRFCCSFFLCKIFKILYVKGYYNTQRKYE